MAAYYIRIKLDILYIRDHGLRQGRLEGYRRVHQGPKSKEDGEEKKDSGRFRERGYCDTSEKKKT